MHDMTGGAGMLRGWVTVWTMQIVWILATMTIAVGLMVMTEIVNATRARRVEAKVPLIMTLLDSGSRERPHS